MTEQYATVEELEAKPTEQLMREAFTFALKHTAMNDTFIPGKEADAEGERLQKRREAHEQLERLQGDALRAYAIRVLTGQEGITIRPS